MKSVLLASMLSLTAPEVLAQENTSRETTNYPVWTISKPVQTLQYRNSVRKDTKVHTGNAWIVTKDVHRSQLLRNERPRTHEVRLGGTPASVISKGVARMQYENK